MEQADSPWPEEITLSPNKAILTVAFNNGEVFSLSAELLRVSSPSAEVQGHGNEEKKILPGKKHITIRHIEPVGHYAIRIDFSDGHDTGIFTWQTLYTYGKNQDDLMAEYLQKLETGGLSRV